MNLRLESILTSNVNRLEIALARRFITCIQLVFDGNVFNSLRVALAYETERQKSHVDRRLPLQTSGSHGSTRQRCVLVHH